MFERFTEKARRLIFFARHEASVYGSPYIETEHLLLGFLHEDQPLLRMFLGDGNIEGKVRSEIEQRITQRERIATSVEIPLTTDCKKALNLASEEAQRLRHRRIGTEHVLLGMLGVEGSLADRMLQSWGLKLEAVRDKVAREFRSNVGVGEGHGKVLVFANADSAGEMPRAALQKFLDGMKSLKSEELIEFFAKDAQFTDAAGKRWDREGILKNFEMLFAPYAKRNAASFVEGTNANTSALLIASVLWKNAILASEQRVWVHRMSVVLIRENVDWRILLMHITPVQVP